MHNILMLISLSKVCALVRVIEYLAVHIVSMYNDAN